MDYMAFLRSSVPKFGDIEGITEEEISALEDKYKVVLPEAYKQYLMIFGKKGGKFMQGTEMRAERLERMRKLYRDDLINTVYDTVTPIGDNWFFFGIDMGNILFFECDGNPDPKVWIIWAIDHVSDIYPSFTAFLKEELDLIWNQQK